MSNKKLKKEPSSSLPLDLRTTCQLPGNLLQHRLTVVHYKEFV
jgi:hypothetical protein